MDIKPKLNTFDATMIVVSLVIGIFRTPAMVASAARTPFLFFLAWGLEGLISLLGALTFAEVGARVAKPGAFYKAAAENYGSVPAVFILFLLGISVNVLLTQTREALVGLAFFASGYPIFRLMRRVNRDVP